MTTGRTYKYPMKKLNVMTYLIKDVKVIGRKKEMEQKFGLRIKMIVKPIMKLNAAKLTNTELTG